MYHFIFRQQEPVEEAAAAASKFRDIRKTKTSPLPFLFLLLLRGSLYHSDIEKSFLSFFLFWESTILL